MAEPASSLKKIPKKRADKIKAASARVARHRADKTAPVLATVSGLLGTIVKDLADLIAEGDTALEHEVRTLLEVIRRFRTRIHTQQQARAGALRKLSERLGQISALLEEMGKPGFELERLQQESERDLGLTKKLRGNVTTRATEAAFILAELEQAVDPLPGLKIASAKVRKENDKRRKGSVPEPKVEAKAGDPTSKPIERSENP